MQRIASTLPLCRSGNRPPRRGRQPSLAGTDGLITAVGIMTLAPPFTQALPVLDSVPSAYSHEFNAELVYDLCAALVLSLIHI